MSARIIIGVACVAAFVGCAGASANSPAPDVSSGAQAAAEQSGLTPAQLVEIAAVLERSGDSVRAQQYLHAALERGADEAHVLPRLLRLYAADGQYRLAIDRAERHLRRHPRAVSLRLLLAALHAAVGAEAQAIQEYERVLRDAPGNSEAHFALGSVLHDAGREPGRADEHFRAYLAIEPRGRYADEARSLLMTELP